jgi:glycosyltransferase involved in cell wall biosynthesis
MCQQICEMKGTVATVCWIPAAPQEGWHSMDRYWRELETLAREDPVENLEITNLLARKAPTSTRRSGRVQRIIIKYAIYPWRVTLLRHVQLIHLLDHSYAHLLRLVPPGSRIVATVFDLVPLRDPDSLLQHQVNRFRKAVENLRLADRVIAVSRETAEDLTRILGIAPERIRVVYPGTNLEKFGKAVAHLPLLNQIPAERKIVLSVGSAQNRKNLGSFVEILRPLAHRFQCGDWVFVRMGELFPANLERAVTQVIGPRNFIQLGPRNGDEVISVFQRASVFILPSVLEGFSFTMMEAMASGTPVVANRMSTNPEVGQDAVAYYDEGDYDRTARAICDVLDDESYAERLRKAGLQRVRALTWASHWSSIKEVYRELLNEPEKSAPAAQRD